MVGVCERGLVWKQDMLGEQRRIEAEQKGDKKMRRGHELFIIFCGFDNRSSSGAEKREIERAPTIMNEAKKGQ